MKTEEEKQFNIVSGLIKNQPGLIVAKNSRVNGQFLELLEKVYQEKPKRIDRQELAFGKITVKMVGNKDVALFSQTDCCPGFTTYDALLDWSGKRAKEFRNIGRNFDIVPLGTGKCTVEVACSPRRQDLIREFMTGGFQAFRAAAESGRLNIVSDLPGIASIFFPLNNIVPVSGATELFDKTVCPITIGIVDTGESLAENDWIRLSITQSPTARTAILAKSQTCLIIPKRR